MGEISDALRRAREQKRRDPPERAPGDARPDRFGAAEAEQILRDARQPDAHGSASQDVSRAMTHAPEAASSRDSEPKDLREARPEATRQPGIKLSRERDGAWPARIVLIDRRSGQAESYRHFAIRLSREMADRELRSVMLGSALRHEGKSTTSCNLALALASVAGGRRTALVDLDLRRPSLARYLQARPALGVDGVLRGETLLRDALLATDIPSLDLYPVAEPMSSPHEVLAGPALPAMMAELESAYDTVVVDSPPLLLVPDAHLILPHVGGLVAVVRSRQTRRAAFEQMIARIPPNKLLGSFINDSRAPKHVKQYGYYLDDDGAGDDTED